MTRVPGGRRVLVTGGGRGIGAAIVRALIVGGHEVTFTYRSASAQAVALIEELKGQFPDRRIAGRQIDLGDEGAIGTFLAELEADAPFSALVHNAGQPYDSLAAVMDQTGVTV